MEGSIYKCEQWGVLHPHPAEDRSWGGPPLPSQRYTCASRAALGPEEEREREKCQKWNLIYPIKPDHLSPPRKHGVKYTMYSLQQFSSKHFTVIY